MKAPDHAVEEVALGGGVVVAGLPSAVVVGPGAGGVGEGSEGPDIADGGEPLVLDAASDYGPALAGGAGDRGCPGAGLETSRVSEA
ncbi:hypothetical protein Ais01nite_21900 [Asanoa ishikariensis]|nr:hypothetical protein Ais01nite_21900 [Asanoa ishikariensis]